MSTTLGNYRDKGLVSLDTTPELVLYQFFHPGHEMIIGSHICDLALSLLHLYEVNTIFSVEHIREDVRNRGDLGLLSGHTDSNVLWHMPCGLSGY